ncbi:MAG: hypothetical protein ACTSPP_09845 [Candidatus Heimdallarchaeaceae archaeon]
MVSLRYNTKNKKLQVIYIILLTIIVFILIAMLLPAITGIFTNLLYVLLTGLWIFLLYKIFMKGYKGAK